VLHIPGHSPGHLGFHWPERRFLIAGDAIATWPELCPGWQAFTLNERLHARSLRRLAGLEPRVVGVGHGEPVTAAAAERVHELAASLPDEAGG
jgi:glyoxylase-like metal-dependent hydrolase (beta-lactamase superfamily II)